MQTIHAATRRTCSRKANHLMRFNFILSIFLSIGLLGCKKPCEPSTAPTLTLGNISFPTLTCILEADNNYRCKSQPQIVAATAASWLYLATFDSMDYSWSSGDLRSTIQIDDNPKRYLETADHYPLRKDSIKSGNSYIITFDGATYTATKTFWKPFNE